MPGPRGIRQGDWFHAGRETRRGRGKSSEDKRQNEPETEVVELLHHHRIPPIENTEFAVTVQLEIWCQKRPS
jgi:hypothetical protein